MALMNMIVAAANHVKERDPTYAISNMCQSEYVTPEIVAEAQDLLQLKEGGWLDTPEQRQETLNLCWLMRMEWDSKGNQKPATATQRLLENGHLAEAALLLGFAPDPQRVPLLLQVLAAMSKAPHVESVESIESVESELYALMQGAQ